MKKLSPFILTVLVSLLFLIGGCDIFELRDRTYDGDKLVEFFPVDITVDEIDESSESATVVTSAVNLISPEGVAQSNLSFDLNVDDSTTAIAGTHYSILSSSPVAIPQDAASAELQIGITADALTEGDVRVLYITIRGSGEVNPAENYKTLEVIIRGRDEDPDTCPNYEDDCP